MISPSSFFWDPWHVWVKVYYADRNFGRMYMCRHVCLSVSASTRLRSIIFGGTLGSTRRHRQQQYYHREAQCSLSQASDHEVNCSRPHGTLWTGEDGITASSLEVRAAVCLLNWNSLAVSCIIMHQRVTKQRSLVHLWVASHVRSFKKVRSASNVLHLLPNTLLSRSPGGLFTFFL